MKLEIGIMGVEDDAGESLMMLFYDNSSILRVNWRSRMSLLVWLLQEGTPRT